MGLDREITDVRIVIIIQRVGLALLVSLHVLEFTQPSFLEGLQQRCAQLPLAEEEGEAQRGEVTCLSHPASRVCS